MCSCCKLLLVPYCTPLFVRHRRGAEHGEQRTVRMFSQLRYRCEHLLNYGTGTGSVLYCTVRYSGPSPACTVRVLVRLYCSTVVPYFTPNIILRARTSTSREVQYSSVPYVFSHKYGTVLLCTFTKLLRYRYRTAVYGTQAPLLLVLVRVRDCTLLYCTRSVLYFKQYSPCSYEYR